MIDNVIQIFTFVLTIVVLYNAGKEQRKFNSLCAFIKCLSNFICWIGDFASLKMKVIDCLAFYAAWPIFKPYHGESKSALSITGIIINILNTNLCFYHWRIWIIVAEKRYPLHGQKMIYFAPEKAKPLQSVKILCHVVMTASYNVHR